MAILMDGKALAAKKTEALKRRVDALKAKGKTPGLRVVQVGDDDASAVYIRQKEKACRELGIVFCHDHITGGKPEEMEAVDELMLNPALLDEYSGTILQLPLPECLQGAEGEIPQEYDVDGLSSMNAGLLFQGYEHGFIPCTAKGVMALLKAYGVPLKGKHAVVVGRSNIVGKPVAMLLLNEDCTVTVCHSKTQFLHAFTRQADILVSAVGKPGLITEEYVKRGAAVIDVGITRKNGNLRGDVDFESVEPVAGWLTPVPGGVGPMTVAMLMENVIIAEERRL